MPAKPKNPEPWAIAQQETLNANLSADLRRLRMKHGSTLVELCNFFGRDKNWLSKAERNERHLLAADYLIVMSLLRHLEPEHPAVALYDYLARNRPRKNLTVVKG